jgi:hypothetical protein
MAKATMKRKNDFVIFLMHEIFRTLAKIRCQPHEQIGKSNKSKTRRRTEKSEAIKMKCCI